MRGDDAKPQVLAIFCLPHWGPGFGNPSHTSHFGMGLVVTALYGIHYHNHYIPNLGFWTWRNPPTYEKKILLLELASVPFVLCLTTLFARMSVRKHYHWPLVTRAEFIIQELQLFVAVELFREQVTIDLARCAIDTAREQLPLWPQPGHLGR